MARIEPNEKGFTLIEVIATLVLVGITAVLGGMLIVSVVEGFVFARTNAGTVQKAQLAMARLTREITAISSVTSAGAGQIIFVRPDSALNPRTITISLSGEALQLKEGDQPASTLTDNVSSFELAYCTGPEDTACSTSWQPSSRIIEVTLTLSGASGTTSEFKKRIVPRNM